MKSIRVQALDHIVLNHKNHKKNHKGQRTIRVRSSIVLFGQPL